MARAVREAGLEQHRPAARAVLSRAHTPADKMPVVQPKPKPHNIPLSVIAEVTASENTNAGAVRSGTMLSVKQDPVQLELTQLKRHCAFLGAAGSSKTSLALSVVKQVAPAH